MPSALGTRPRATPLTHRPKRQKPRHSRIGAPAISIRLCYRPLRGWLGSDGVTRTRDPVINSHLLYRLSYVGNATRARLARLPNHPGGAICGWQSTRSPPECQAAGPCRSRPRLVSARLAAYTRRMVAPSSKSTAKPAAKAAEPQRVVRAEDQLDALLQTQPLPAVFTVISGRFASEGRSNDNPVADPRALLAAARRIEAVALAQGDKALDYVQIDYLDGDHQATGIHWVIAQELRSTSLFGGTRVVTVTHADTLSFQTGKGKAKRGKAKAQTQAVEQDPVERLLQSVEQVDGPPPWVLILVIESMKRDSAEFKALARAGVVVEVAPFTIQALQEYLAREGAQHKIRVERPVAQVLWDRLGGNDAARLRNAADRLLLQAGPGGLLSEAMALVEVPMDRDAAVWGMSDALQAADRARALTLVHLLIHDGGNGSLVDQGLKLLSALNSHYMRLARLRDMQRQGVSIQEMMAFFGVKEFVVRKMQGQLGRLRPGQLERTLQALVEADALIKSQPISGMERLVLALLGDRSLRASPLSLADAFGLEQ